MPAHPEGETSFPYGAGRRVGARAFTFFFFKNRRLARETSNAGGQKEKWV